MFVLLVLCSFDLEKTPVSLSLADCLLAAYHRTVVIRALIGVFGHKSRVTNQTGAFLICNSEIQINTLIFRKNPRVNVKLHTLLSPPGRR